MSSDPLLCDPGVTLSRLMKRGTLQISKVVFLQRLHMNLARILSIGSLLLPLHTYLQAEDKIGDVNAANIVAKALPSIREGGERWINDKQCLSCHRISFQVWALNRASEAGYELDHDKLLEWNQWATNWQHLVAPERRADATEEAALAKDSDTISQLLLGRTAQADEGHVADWVETYRFHLLKAQRESGSWEPAGQLPSQKRPKRETEEVTTMWTLLGLRNSGIDLQDLQAASEKAMRWLGSKTDGQSTEWWAARLLLHRSAEHEGIAQKSLEKLLSSQNEDGGWGWLLKDQSDALGTGIALYALAHEGVAIDDSVIEHAVEFLGSTQQEDGSWKVNGTKTNARDRVTETASYWGTCWSVIGLLEIQRTGHKYSLHQTIGVSR